MKHISIYWEKDSSDLVIMLQDLGNIGQTCGNDGCELAVTESELARIRDYIADDPSKFTLEVYDTDEATLQQYVDSWRALHG
jgi:hypothetical protein